MRTSNRPPSGGLSIGTALVLLTAAATTGVPDATSGTPVVVLLLLGTVCVAAGAIGFRRRDILSS